jgi:hypothetical protein
MYEIRSRSAKHTSDFRIRASFVQMAQRWLDLAELSEHDKWNGALRLRALAAAIGEELRALYELPQNIPHSLLTLLMQINAEREGD